MSKEEKYLFVINMIKNDEGCSEVELEKIGFTDFDDVIKEIALKGLEVLLKGLNLNNLKRGANMTGEEFANELKHRLNFNLNRYIGGSCNGREFPNIETFDVDEVYECIDRILDGIPEDTND